MKKIALSLLTIIAVVAIAGTATWAYLSDNETSNGNTFSAGTIDLNLDGGNTNVVKFTVANMSPDDQVIKSWNLKNNGSLKGYVDLENISVKSHENGCLDPETEQGDATCGNPGDGEGEMQNLVSLSKLFWDTNCDGWVGAGEPTIYDGKVGAIASHYEQNVELAAGASKCVTAQMNWWSNGASDNLGQGDSMDLDLTFELAETASQ